MAAEWPTGRSPGADPAVPAVMGLLLLLQPVEEVADQLLRRILGELFFVKTEGLRHLLRPFQPLFEQRLRDVGQIDIRDLLERRPRK